MHRSLVNVLLSALFVLCLAPAVHAVVSPHQETLGCTGCHVDVMNNALANITGVNNLCLSCHNPATISRSFSTKDLANPFGSTDLGVYAGGQLQTSHNWAAPTKVPAAGASIPAASVMANLKATGLGLISCASCHDNHAYPGMPNSNPKLLRLPLTNDQLCFECHSARNQRNHLTGTHPVNFTYTSATSKVKIKPGEYNALPVNANPSNPTSAMKLSNGKLVCTTCHGAHFTDSNSQTFDNASSSQLGNLTASQGNLLRTDMRGATATDVNICTNCHAGKLTHNNKGQNIQCTDCHGGHVDPGDGTIPNVWLIRRYMNYSGGVQLDSYRKKVLNQAVGSQSNWAGTFGVCQSCHNVPAPGGTYPSEHASTDPDVCRSCHTHSSKSGSFAANCTGCHGFPPAQNIVGGPNGFANNGTYSYDKSSAYKDESKTPHTAHAGKGTYQYGCSVCHAGNTHATGNFQQVFLAKAGLPASGGVTPGYNTANPGTCSVYCHSDGAPRGAAAATTKAVTWANGAGSIISTSAECVACHDGVVGTTNTLNSNAHRKHVSNDGTTGKAYTCNICHAATAGSNTTIVNPANHVNGVKDVAFSGVANGSSFNGADATCITYCHSNGGNLALRTYAAPAWTNKASGACGSCHAAAPGLTGGAIINTNGHSTHFDNGAGSYGPMFTTANATGCQNCHTSFTGEFGLTHVDGTIQVLSSCVPCHTKPGSYAWNGGQIACESCHTGSLSQINGINAPDKSLFTTLGHGQFSGKSDQCLLCHQRNDSHISANANTHVTRLGASYQGINENLLCAKCHNDVNVVTNPARQNMPTHVSQKTNPPVPNNCSACHDVHGSGNLNAINGKFTFSGNSTATVAFTNTSTGFVNNKTNRGLCQICHTQTNHYKRDKAESAHPTRDCLACHSHKGEYAFKPNGNCNTCHGYPPVANMTGRGVSGSYSSARLETFNGGGYVNGGGAHTVSAHVKPGAIWQQAWSNCSMCHDSTRHKMVMPLQQQAINITIDPKVWANSAVPATYNGPLNGTGTGAQSTGTCSNVYCHSNGDGGAPNNTTFTWSSPAGTLGCTGCHGNVYTSSNPIASGKHSAHTNPNINISLGIGNELACTECHAKTLSANTTLITNGNHVNGMKDYSGSRAGSYNLAVKQCSNVYCHSNGNKGALVFNNPAAWNSATTYGCNGCHGTSSPIGAPDYANGGAGTATANSHNAHTAGYSDTAVCSNCHFVTASTTGGKLKDNSAHLNNVVNVAFNPAVAGVNASFDPATGTCSNIACHGNGSAQWGSKAGCLTCHSLSIGKRAAITTQFNGNSHHVQGVSVSGEHCFQCHWEANSDGSINHSYHHSSVSGSPVELVIYGAGARPTTYIVGTTAVQYTANGTRTEMTKINAVCIGCHSDQNKAIQPFGDGKTPAVYAWDGTSIGNKYSDTSTTPWGKYSGGNLTPKSTVTKAFSAHGNAVNNKGGWDTTETWKDRGANANVLCFDCHNSHGSTVEGVTTSYTSSTTNGGIFKDTVANTGGYAVTYKPTAGGSAAEHNAYNPGAGLCFDCHMKSGATDTPWGYNATYGATQQIMGYWDSAYFGNNVFGNQLRYPYKGVPGNMGGHLGASKSLNASAAHQIGGLCTPCHDPHGVSPTMGTNMKYGVPLLKGTWMTSIYKEDVATADNQSYDGMGGSGGRRGPSASSSEKAAYKAATNDSYHIDQNSLPSGTNITETDVQFAGLCLNCHAKTNLTNGSTHTWKDKNRIHEAVKGWKTANKTIQHNYTCSKCHTAHNADLPRLMVTNCLDAEHRGRVAYNSKPVTSGNGSQDRGNGSGHMPGIFDGGEGGRGGWGGWGSSSGSGWSSGSTSATVCHDNNDATQKWNNVTQWGAATTTGPTVPVLITEPNATCTGSCATTLQWNASTNSGGAAVQYQIQVSSSSVFTTVNYSSGWISGTSYTPTMANGTWYWRVQARDSVTTSKVSAWSSVGSFTLSSATTSTNPPTVPVLIAESDARCSSYSGCSIGLQWNASINPSGGSVQYMVQVSSSSSFSSIKAQSSWQAGTSWSTTLGKGTWYWRVQARDASVTTRVSTWSIVDSFVLN